MIDDKIDVLGLLDKIMHDTPEIPDWLPERRGICACGHSWLFHWLKEPHRCNDCKECSGYVFAPRPPTDGGKE